MRNYFFLGCAVAVVACQPKMVRTQTDDAEVYSVRAVLRCKQNSPDGEVNLRASPSTSGTVVDVLKTGRSLVKVDEVSGPGCDKPWAKLEHDKGYVYGCRSILNCYKDQTADSVETVVDGGDLARCVERTGVSAVNMRSAPTVYDSRVLAVLDGGVSMRLLGTVPAGNGCGSAWYKLAGQTNTVYVCSDFASCQKTGGSVSNPTSTAQSAPVNAPSSTLPTTSTAPSTASTSTSSGGVDLQVPYLCQYNNSVAPGGTCQVTSFTMAYRYLTGKALSPDSLAYNRGGYQSPDGMASYARTHWGLRGSYGRSTGSEDEMKRELRAGHPIAVNFCGTRSGHVILIVGYNSEGWIVNDPAGRWSGNSFNNPVVGCGGFPNDGGVAYPSSCNGKKVVYKYSTFRRAASDGNTTHNYWYTVLAK